jgi:hypothetical protein
MLDLEFLAYMCKTTLTINTLPAHLLYIGTQSGLPIGYYKVIRGWWNRRYDAEEAKRLLEEIDGGEAFRHHVEKYLEQREKRLTGKELTTE